MRKKKVLVILGSPSDEEKMLPCIQRLQRDEDVEIEVRVRSAHRTLLSLVELVQKKTDADVIICGAGMAAALPGVVASLTDKPVIGVPLSGSALNGEDALFAIAQMPPGIPVATVAIDGAKNAAILALRILATSCPAISARLSIERSTMASVVLEKDDKFSAKYSTY